MRPGNARARKLDLVSRNDSYDDFHRPWSLPAYTLTRNQCLQQQNTDPMHPTCLHLHRRIGSTKEWRSVVRSSVPGQSQQGIDEGQSGKDRRRAVELGLVPGTGQTETSDRLVLPLSTAKCIPYPEQNRASHMHCRCLSSTLDRKKSISPFQQLRSFRGVNTPPCGSENAFVCIQGIEYDEGHKGSKVAQYSLSDV